MCLGEEISGSDESGTDEDDDEDGEIGEDGEKKKKRRGKIPSIESACHSLYQCNTSNSISNSLYTAIITQQENASQVSFTDRKDHISSLLRFPWAIIRIFFLLTFCACKLDIPMFLHYIGKVISCMSYLYTL